MVFCEGDRGIIANFQNNYPNIPLEVYYVNVTDDMETAIMEYGEPDIIIGYNISYDNTRFLEGYENGHIADIRAFYDADGSIVESDYVPGTFSIMDTGEALLGVPLSWGTRCLLIRDSKW